MNRLELFLQLVEDNRRASQTLARVPEPDSVTAGEPNVAQYNRVLHTNMTANYATSMDLIHRARSSANTTALDLCSGPGLVTLSMAQHLKYQNVVGCDLSDGMVKVATENARRWGLDHRVSFKKADVLNLREAQHSYDLVSITNSAHHLPALSDVASLLAQADEIAKPEGLVVLTDIGRLKTKELTDRFIELAGEEFLKLNMPDMYEDFRNSMYAGFTADELALCVPRGSKRHWVQLIPTGLTTYHALLGLPVDRSELFVRDSYPWEQSGLLKSAEAQNDWNVMKLIIETAQVRNFAPNRQSLPGSAA